MKKKTELLKARLLEDMTEGYIIPDETDNDFLNMRLYARRFCHDRFLKEENDDLFASEVKQLCIEAAMNGTLFFVLSDAYKIAYYKGYQRAVDELKGESK